MAKIDTSTIQGYAEMTAEQKIAALEAMDMPEPDMTGFVKKEVLDKAASEAAEWKKKYNSTLSAAEQQKQADEEAQTLIKTRLAELERKDKISTAKDQYIASGFSVELAVATAEAFVDGKMDVVLANITKHAANVATEAKDKALKGTPTPPAGGGTGTIDYEAELAKAHENGDMTRAAYLCRLMATPK